MLTSMGRAHFSSFRIVDREQCCVTSFAAANAYRLAFESVLEANDAASCCLALLRSLCLACINTYRKIYFLLAHIKTLTHHHHYYLAHLSSLRIFIQRTSERERKKMKKNIKKKYEDDEREK